MEVRRFCDWAEIDFALVFDLFKDWLLGGGLFITSFGVEVLPVEADSISLVFPSLNLVEIGNFDG